MMSNDMLFNSIDGIILQFGHWLEIFIDIKLTQIAANNLVAEGVLLLKRKMISQL